jgi:hypothetical protein
MSFPLGASTSIVANTAVKYRTSGVTAQGAERISALSGWGAADGRLVAFGPDTPSKDATKESPSKVTPPKR